MSEDRAARRNRGNPRGLWLLVALGLAVGLLIIAVVLKSIAADQRASRELEDVVAHAEAPSSTPAPAR
jgi:hypothetical protein